VISAKRCGVEKKDGSTCGAWAVRGQDACRAHLTGAVQLVPRQQCRCSRLPYPHRFAPKCGESSALMPLPPAPAPVEPTPRAQRRPNVPLNAERRGIILELLSQGARPIQAAKVAGIHPDTFRRHLKSEPDWRDQVQQAQDDAVEMVEHAMWKLATGELPGPQFEAAKFWLLCRGRDRGWTDPRSVNVQVSGQLEHVMDSATMLAEIAVLEETLRARVLAPPVLEAVVIDDETGD
jgi:hypothetical protein